MGVNFLIGSVVNLAVNLADNWINALEKQQETTEKLQGELSGICSEISEINSQLETTADRINKLNSKDSLSFIEKGELSRLIAENNELERKKRLLEEQEAAKQKETAASVQKEFDMKYGGRIYEKVRTKEDSQSMRRKRERYYELYLNDYKTDEEISELDILSQELDAWDNASSSFTDHIKELVSAYEDLNQKKKNGAKLDPQEENRLAEYRKELVDTALDLSDYSERYGIDDAASQSWDDLAQAIDRCLYPEEYRTDKFNELFSRLPSDIQQHLTQLAQNGTLSVKHLSDTMLTDFTQAGFTAEEILEQIYATLENASAESRKHSLLSVFDTIKQISGRLQPALDSLASAYQNVFTSDDNGNLLFIPGQADLSLFDSIRSQLDGMAQAGLPVDYSAFENFVTVLSATKSKEKDVQTAFNALASSITQAALSGTEDFATLKSALADLGVANSELTAFKVLIKNTNALKESGLDLADASYSEMVSFARTQVSAQNFTEALTSLRIQKILCKDNPLNTAGDIQNLYLLAKSAGIATDAVQTLLSLNLAYTKASSEGNTLAALAVRGQMEIVKKQVIDQFSTLDSEFDFSKMGQNASKAAGNAGSAAADAYLDAFEKELKDLQNLKDNGILSEKEYLDRLRILYEHYFKDKAQYAEQYAQYEREYLNGYKSLYESLFSHASSLVGGRISLLQEEKDAAIEALEAQKKAAEESYETQIRLLEDKKAAIQDEIDRIREANEDRKEALSLQEKEQALARAEAQRTLLRYSEDRGFYYDTDTESIQEARKELDDARADAEIRALEKQQDALDSQIDSLKEMADAASEYWDTQKEQTEEYYDALIGRMEEYKSRWEELAGLQEQARMAALAKELGYSGEDLINESSGALEHLKLTYLGILKDLNARNPDFLDSLSRLAGQDLGHIPGFLEGTRQAMEGLAQTDTSALAGGLQDIGKNLSSVASSAGDAAAAISGDGVTGTPGEPAQADGGAGQTAGTKTVPKGKVSLKAAIRDLSTQSVEGIAKISGAFAGEDGEGASVTGAIQKVTDKLGNADPENAEPDSLMAVQKEQAREALDEEHGIPAQEQAWESLNGPLEKAAAAVTALQEALEDMDGREYTVTIHTLGDGGALVDTVLGSYSTQNQSGRPLTGSPAAVSGSSGNRSRHGGGNHDGRGGSFTADAEPAPESKAAGFPDTVRPLPPQYIPYPPENDHSRSAEMYRTFRAAIEDSGKMTDFLAAAPKINPVNQFTGFSGERSDSHINTTNLNSNPVVSQTFHITMPNVTNSTSAEALMADLQSIGGKKYQFFSTLKKY